MTDNATQTSEAVNTSQSAEPVKKLTLEEYFAETKLPEPALRPITDKVAELLALVKKSDGLVADINTARADDPNNVENLDRLWKANESDEAIADVVAEFYAVAEQYEKLNAQLREHAKMNYVKEAMSPEALQAAKKSVNEMAPVIAEARKGLASQFAIPESMLGMMNIPVPEGGLITLLPQAESLKNARGRKAATSSGEVKAYVTRVGDVLIEGTSTQVNGNGKIAYAADKLSERFNSRNIPANSVTPEEIEEQYFKSLNLEFRSVASTKLPDEHSFTFEKTILVQNTNDDSKTEVPQKVKLTVRSVNFGEKAEEPKTETAKVEAKSEAPKVENSAPKVESKPAETMKVSDHVRPEPAKKAATPQPKK